MSNTLTLSSAICWEILAIFFPTTDHVTADHVTDNAQKIGTFVVFIKCVRATLLSVVT